MLEGNSVILRCVKEEDLSRLYMSMNSLRMKGEYLSAELISEHQFRLQFYETSLWSEDRGMLMILHKERLVGAIWYEKAPLDALDLHFYTFDKADRNKGYMKEAIMLFSRYLFATKKIERIQVSIPDYSQAALKLVQRCKFQFEGIARSAFFHRGSYLDLCIYSMLRSECKEIEKIYPHADSLHR